MKNISKYRLIVGLGNPGRQYAFTYHNIGQLTMDYLIKKTAETMTFIQKGKQKKFEFFKFTNSRDLIFIKALTFMNETGEAVAASLEYFSAFGGKIDPKEILIIHDDSDIELGKSKFSFGREAAGHHGVESIIKNLKTKNFWRLRIGIRHKIQINADQDADKRGLNISTNQRGNQHKSAPKRKKAEELVLKNINPADKLVLDKFFTNLEI